MSSTSQDDSTSSSDSKSSEPDSSSSSTSSDSSDGSSSDDEGERNLEDAKREMFLACISILPPVPHHHHNPLDFFSKEVEALSISKSPGVAKEPLGWMGS